MNRWRVTRRKRCIRSSSPLTPSPMTWSKISWKIRNLNKRHSPRTRRQHQLRRCLLRPPFLRVVAVVRAAVILVGIRRVLFRCGGIFIIMLEWIACSRYYGNFPVDRCGGSDGTTAAVDVSFRFVIFPNKWCWCRRLQRFFCLCWNRLSCC